MLEAATLFLVAAVGYIVLRSSDYVYASGATRAFQVYYCREPFLHTNEHMLYPVNIFLWTRALYKIGLSATTPSQFIGFAQAMNAIAAGGVLSILYLLCAVVTNQPRLSLLASASYGVSRAFVTHATNSSEPMAGLFWSLLAVLLAGASLRLGKPLLGLLGGAALLLSMATYQGMVLIGPAILVLIWYWPEQSLEHHPAASRIRSIAFFLTGCVAGLFVIYGSAYYLSGARGLLPIMRRFVHVPAQQLYGGFAVSKLFALPLGFTYALLPCLPLDCPGFRCLLDPGRHAWIGVVLLSLVLVGGIAALVGFLLPRIWKDLNRLERLVIMCCSTGLLFDGLALAYWMPTYDKLWLQPMACIFLLSAIVAKATMQRGDLPFRLKKLFTIGAVCLLITMAASNISVVAYRHFTVSPYLLEAEQVAKTVTSKDLLVGDWNGVLLLHQYIWAERGNTFNVPTDAIHNKTLTGTRLQDRIAATQRSGGQVYFLGILDIPQARWIPVVGDYGPSYAAFERYRECSRAVSSFESDEGVITLRLLANPLDRCELTDQAFSPPGAICPIVAIRGKDPRSSRDGKGGSFHHNRSRWTHPQ